MRTALAAILAMVMVAPPLASGGVEDAVAPAQVVADAAALLVTSAISESDRDGSADVARALEARIDTFTRATERDWHVPTNATFALEATKALVTARAVRQAVAGLPAATEVVAVGVTKCGRAPPTPAEFADARLAFFALEVAAAELRTALEQAPPALDARGLGAAITRLEAWLPTHDPLTRCGPPAESILTILLRPAIARPGEAVTVLGVATQIASVTVHVPTLNVTLEAPVERTHFATRFVVPLEPVIGPHTVRVTSNATTATATLTVVKFPADLRLTGPSRSLPGADGQFVISLGSARRQDTDNATIEIAGAVAMNVTLTDGRATFPVTFPDEPGEWQIAVTFPGTALVARATRSWTTTIGEPPTSPEVPVDVRFSPDVVSYSWFGAIAAGLVLVLIAASALMVLRRRKRAHPEAIRTLATTPRPITSASATSAPVSFFGRLAAWLRERGEATPGSTARELAVKLRAHDADPGDLVFAFERVRYGGEPETPSFTSRFKTWAADAWRRLTGAVE